MSVSVVIPTLNAERWLDKQLSCLLSQTVDAEIIVIDSGSTDATSQISARYAPHVRLLEIPNEDFDHGRTRDYGLRQSGGDFVLFLTQDALPTDAHYIEKLLEPLSNERVAGVFGRQIAWEDAPAFERLTRLFNYPETGRVWSEADIPRYGVKSYFFSNSCSAIRRSAYEAVGGFDAPIITNEDMMLAAKLLHAGWSLAYAPEAAVWHSHVYTLPQVYKRNVQIGRVMEQYRERLTRAEPTGEGLRMVRFVCGELLCAGKFGQIPAFLMRAAVRFMGYRAGKRLESNTKLNLKTHQKSIVCK